MCVILYLAQDLNISYNNIVKYFDKIKYRGPDNTTIQHIDKHYFLPSSIINNQPRKWYPKLK